MEYSTRRFFFLLAALCLLPMAARAQNPSDNPITMQIASPLAFTEKPFSLQRRQGRWFPIAVTLTNSGAAVKGRLTLRLKASGGFEQPTSQFFTDIELPQTARKRVWLYGRIEREETDGLEVTFSGRGFRGLKASGAVAEEEIGRRIVLTISDSGERLAFLSNARANGLALSEEARGLDEASREQLAANPVRPLGASGELIPDRWIGLDSVNQLVLSDFSHNALSNEQIAALQGYVAAGGVLVVPGGADWQRLAQSPLKNLWPVLPNSSATAADSEVALLAREYVAKRLLTAGDRLGGAPVLLQRGAVQPNAQVVVKSVRGPLMVKTRRGAGLVIWTAFDPARPPFAGWDGQPRLWAQIFQQHLAPPRIEGTQNYGYYDTDAVKTQTGVLRDALASAPQLRTPPVSYIVWFLALYVFFLVPVNYTVLRYFDKREWAWLTIPIIVLAFSGLSYAAAFRIKGNAILTRQVNIVQGSAGSGLARADSMLWLFSPRRTTYNIRNSAPQSAVANYVGAEDAGVSIFQPDPRASFVLQDTPVRMWDWKTFTGHAVVNAGQGISLGEGQMVRNNTPFTLRGVVLISGERAWSYGEIKAGATAKFKKSEKFSGGQRNGAVQRLSGIETLFPSQNYGGATLIVNSLLTLALSQNKSAGQTLIGWSDQLPARLDIGESAPRAQNITLFVFEM